MGRKIAIFPVLQMDNSFVVLSGLLAEVAGLLPCLGLKLRGEIVGTLEIELICNLLDGEVGGAEQFLGSLYLQRLLV